MLLATYRAGGLDIAFSGLGGQTFPKDEFEVILCDTWYEKRKDAVNEYAKKFSGLPLVHVPAFRTQNPLDSSEKDRNSAIAYAEGELCIFLCDYGLVRQDFVERHWFTYTRSEKKATSMAPHHYKVPPELKPDWEGQPISIFKEELTAEAINKLPEWVGGQDPKLNMQAGTIPYQFCHLKNESFPTELLMQMNGCDEFYNVDGGHLMGDTDLAMRAVKLGHEFVLDPHNILEIVQVREFYPILQRHRGLPEDQAYFDSRKNAPVAPPVQSGYNDFNMRELREKMVCEKRQRS